jgi:signal peptidase II
VKQSWLSAAVLCAGIAIDQLSKHWADAQLKLRGIVEVVPGLLDLRYARNPGAFFSLGAGLPPSARRIVLTLAGTVVLGLIGALYRRTAAGQGRLRMALVLLASGAIGNLIDRVRSGEVVDFVHLHYGAVLRWATFNVADALITFGLVLLSWEMLSPQAGPTERRREAPARSH